MNRNFTLALLLLALTACDRAPVSPPPGNAPATKPTVEIAPPTPAPPVDDRLPQALALRRDGKPTEARVLLQELAMTNPPEQVVTALGEINLQILFSPAPAAEKVDYTVQSGDALGKLAKQFNTTIELIKKANNLSSDTIRIGQRLRIYQGQFAVNVSKSANTLTLTDHDRLFKRYRVGTGQYAKTPVGEFKVTNRLASPPWYRPDGQVVPFGDPANILGTHWLGIDVPGFGIHGTWDTNSIGKQASAGCVRLLNDDVAELYIILPVGTPVRIHD